MLFIPLPRGAVDGHGYGRHELPYCEAMGLRDNVCGQPNDGVRLGLVRGAFPPEVPRRVEGDVSVDGAGAPFHVVAMQPRKAWAFVPSTATICAC